MNRREKHKWLYLNKRISRTKNILLSFSTCIIFIFSIGLISNDSYSYFNSEVKTAMDVKNATKEEIVLISQQDLIYQDKCKAILPVKIKNIFDYEVVITIMGTTYNLQPGQEITHQQIVADSCGGFGTKTVNVIGYEHYFDHQITVYVDKDKLNPCPPQSDNGQGKPNEKGEGKHCGNNGKDSEDLVNKNALLENKVEVEKTPVITEEKTEEPLSIEQNEISPETVLTNEGATEQSGDTSVDIKLDEKLD